jgi:N utilization substance protein B
MAVIDRNILRIAVCELLYEKTLAPAIIMNEAIEIAKRYSGEESAVFVNGVLDAVGRLLNENADKPATAAGPDKAGEHE